MCGSRIARLAAGRLAWSFAAVVVLSLAGRAPAETRDEGSCALRGTVVTERGESASAAKVVVVKHGEGYLRIGHDGALDAQANVIGIDVPIFRMFRKKDAQAVATVVTDEKGGFVIENLKEGTFTLLATHPEHGWGSRDAVELSGDGARLDVKLAPGCWIEGRVPRPTGKRADRPMVLVQRAPEKSEDRFVFTYFIDPVVVERDRFRVGPLPAGRRYRVSLQSWTDKRSDPVVWRSVVVHTTSSAEHHVSLLPPGDRSLVGRITDTDGKPLRDVTVHLITDAKNDERIGGVTDKTGRYEIAGVPEGKHRLVFSRHEPSPG